MVTTIDITCMLKEMCVYRVEVDYGVALHHVISEPLLLHNIIHAFHSYLPHSAMALLSFIVALGR